MERKPFDAAELTPKTFNAARNGLPPMPVYTTPVSPRENYMSMVLKKEKPLWIPLAGEIVNIAPRVVPDNIARSFIMEDEPFDPNTGGGKDMFGTEWVYVPVAGGSMVKPGNPALDDASEWEKVITFPDIDTYDWAGSKEANAARCDTDRPILVWQLNGMFERLISFMDFEGAVMALIDEDQKDGVHRLFSKLADLYCQYVDHYIEAYNLNILYFHDDWGSQRAPFFSVATAKEMIAPYLKKITDYCHSKGIVFEFHCCGQVEMLVPAMIEAGIDVWCGQPMNDKEKLHGLYGKDIVLGIEPETLPVDASDEECYAAAKKFVDKYGPAMDTAPVYCNLRVGPVKYQDYIYELSRKMLNP